VSQTERVAAVARQLLARHGVLTREAVAAEGISGGFSALYPALKAMDEAGRVRRGYFVTGLGATQFAMPGALELLRSLREPQPDTQAGVVAASDPANPYGTSLPWPVPNLTRTVGAAVVLVDGAMIVYIARGNREITVSLPQDEPFRSRAARAAAREVIAYARGRDGQRRQIFIARINDEPALDHGFAAYLEEAGFMRASTALHLPRHDHHPVEEPVDEPFVVDDRDHA